MKSPSCTLPVKQRLSFAVSRAGALSFVLANRCRRLQFLCIGSPRAWFQIAANPILCSPTRPPLASRNIAFHVFPSRPLTLIPATSNARQPLGDVSPAAAFVPILQHGLQWCRCDGIQGFGGSGGQFLCGYFFDRHRISFLNQTIVRSRFCGSRSSPNRSASPLDTKRHKVRIIGS